MKKAIVGLMSILILAGIALAGQTEEETKGAPSGGMMEQMMGDRETMGGMKGMMGMMNMMGQMSKMMEQCGAMMESMHKDAGQGKQGENKPAHP